MSEVLDMQVYSLLARIHETREHGCRQLRESAGAEARQLVAEARQRARQRVKDAVVEKRRRVEEHCRRVRVGLEARRRDELFAELGERLAAGLATLPTALEERWADAAKRRTWCHCVLEGAARVLRAGKWTLLVAPGPGAAELREMAATAGELAGEAVEIEVREDLAAGLVVAHDGARYDGTIAGLVSDRNAVQSALLAEMATLEGGS
jgi:vacuolar-type H+-ATPase subunit H